MVGCSGRAPDFCKKLIKAWFNGGGITTRPLVLQRERPRTAGGRLISPPTLCCSSLMGISKKSVKSLARLCVPFW